MKLQKLFELTEYDSETLSDMDLSDALYVLSEMVEDDKLTENEILIIEDMFDKLLNEENDDFEYLEEAEIHDHGDTAKKRTANFEKAPMTDRIQNRIYQRRYRKRSDVKMRAKKRAAVQKRCKGNMTAQVSRPGSSSYTCKLKDKFRSKLMKRVAQRYNN